MPLSEAGSQYHTFNVDDVPKERSRVWRRRRLVMGGAVLMMSVVAIASVVYLSGTTTSLQNLPDGKHYLMGMLRDKAELMRKSKQQNAKETPHAHTRLSNSDDEFNKMAATLEQGTVTPEVKTADQDAREQLAQSNAAYQTWLQKKSHSVRVARAHQKLQQKAQTHTEMLWYQPVLAQQAAPAPVPSAVDPMAPSFVVPPTPAAGSQLVAKCQVSFSVQALGLHSGDHVTLAIQSPAPAGGQLLAPTNGNPATAVFSWTPPAGTQPTTVCFSATDSHSLTRVHCVTVTMDPSCSSQSSVASPAKAAPAPAPAPAAQPANLQAPAPAPPPAQPQQASHKDCAPLFAYSNKDLKDHFYTTNFKELMGGKLHYIFHGVMMGVYAVQHEGMVPVFRYYNDRSHDHVYTMSYSKWGAGSSGMSVNGAVGHTYEGISFYVYQSPRVGAKPLYMWTDQERGTVIFSPSKSHAGQGAGPGFKFHRLVGYAGCTP